LASVEAFTFFPLRIQRIVLRSSPVCLVVSRSPRADLRDQGFIGSHATSVVVNAVIVDVFDEVIFALFKTGYFLPDAML
jgi:hypothetical protein